MPFARSHEVCLQMVFALLVAMHTDFMQKTFASEARHSLRRDGPAQVFPWSSLTSHEGQLAHYCIGTSLKYVHSYGSYAPHMSSSSPPLASVVEEPVAGAAAQELAEAVCDRNSSTAAKSSSVNIRARFCNLFFLFTAFLSSLATCFRCFFMPSC